MQGQVETTLKWNYWIWSRAVQAIFLFLSLKKLPNKTNTKYKEQSAMRIICTQMHTVKNVLVYTHIQKKKLAYVRYAAYNMSYIDTITLMINLVFYMWITWCIFHQLVDRPVWENHRCFVLCIVASFNSNTYFFFFLAFRLSNWAGKNNCCILVYE